MLQRVPDNGLRFRWEEWAMLRPIIYPLWERHNAEIASDAHKPYFDPDWEEFDRLAALNADHWVAAWNDGILVGYVFAIFTPGHRHRRTRPSALWDLYWLSPEFRKGMNGYNLVKTGRDSLRIRGAKDQYLGTKVWKDVGPIFERLGFKETERLYVLSEK